MFVEFLDASKAFDKINHNILFQRLKDNNIPLYIIIFLITGIETNVYIYIKWCNNSSDSFPVSRGVCQDGILSPLLINLYINHIIKKLN